MEPCNETIDKACSIEVVSEDPLSSSLINILKDDCLLHIFEYLQIKDKVKIERVCRHWQNISKYAWRSTKKIDGSEALWGFKICEENKSAQTEIFKRVLDRCGRYLIHIDFSDFDIEDDILHLVGGCCTNLEFIDARYLNWSDQAFKALTGNCDKIKHLSIRYCSSCDDECLTQLFLKNQNLKFLRLCKNNNINGKCLLSLPTESIETIIVHYCHGITMEHFVSAVNNFRKLRTLVIDCHSPFENHKDSISLPENLTELELTRDIYSTMDLYKLTLLSKLEILDICHPNVTDGFLLVLAKNCTNISELHMNGCKGITDVGVKTITRLLKIKVLSIRHTVVSDQALKYFTTLKRLYCSFCINIEDDGICELIASNENIELLDFLCCRKITNRVVEQAVNLKTRKNDLQLSIDLRGTSVKTCEFPEIPPYLYFILGWNPS